MEGPCDQKNGVAEEHMTYSKTDINTWEENKRRRANCHEKRVFREKNTN